MRRSSSWRQSSKMCCSSSMAAEEAASMSSCLVTMCRDRLGGPLSKGNSGGASEWRKKKGVVVISKPVLCRRVLRRLLAVLAGGN